MAILRVGPYLSSGALCVCGGDTAEEIGLTEERVRTMAEDLLRLPQLYGGPADPPPSGGVPKAPEARLRIRASEPASARKIEHGDLVKASRAPPFESPAYGAAAGSGDGWSAPSPESRRQVRSRPSAAQSAAAGHQLTGMTPAGWWPVGLQGRQRLPQDAGSRRRVASSSA